jgi:hypothetical protein
MSTLTRLTLATLTLLTLALILLDPHQAHRPPPLREVAQAEATFHRVKD